MKGYRRRKVGSDQERTYIQFFAYLFIVAGTATTLISIVQSFRGQFSGVEYLLNVMPLIFLCIGIGLRGFVRQRMPKVEYVWTDAERFLSIDGALVPVGDVKSASGIYSTCPRMISVTYIRNDDEPRYCGRTRIYLGAGDSSIHPVLTKNQKKKSVTGRLVTELEDFVSGQPLDWMKKTVQEKW